MSITNFEKIKAKTDSKKKTKEQNLSCNATPCDTARFFDRAAELMFESLIATET